MGNRKPNATGEWYHCYNRGVDKRIVFCDEDDCERLLVLLYLCNDEDSNTRIVDLDLRYVSLAKLLTRNTIVRGTPLVDIGAHALLPNHVHLIVKQLVDGGLARFMQKVFTGYTMYFNKKYERTGPLFSGAYKSKHLDTDEYFKYAIQYVLFNPVELIEPDWKIGRGNIAKIEKHLMGYKYASVPDFFGVQRAEGKIVCDVRKEYFDRKPKLRDMLKNAQEYYHENAKFLES